jgi:hypothetical protein
MLGSGYGGFVVGLIEALQEADPVLIRSALEELYPAQINDHWAELSAFRVSVLTLLAPADAAEVFSNLEETEQAELIQSLPPWRVKEILDELSLDDLTDTINAVEEENPDQAEALLQQLDPQTRANVEELAEYLVIRSSNYKDSPLSKSNTSNQLPCKIMAQPAPCIRLSCCKAKATPPAIYKTSNPAFTYKIVRS